MRLRADQVRAGHRIDGATVMKVRPTLDWGMVRITVENTRDARDPRDAASGIANGTFCYLADDVLEVDRPLPAGNAPGPQLGGRQADALHLPR